MDVVVIGAGRMGSQIACEYALGQHRVTVLARDPARAREAVGTAFDLARRLTDAPPQELDAAQQAVTVAALADDGALPPGAGMIVESVAEDLDVKAAVLEPLARALPGATIASNTSSLSISAIGEAAGAPERTLGTHYWNPPLLMRLVELTRGADTDPQRVDVAAETLRRIGKEPVAVERDVPGFIWNRLQFALLREALWLVDNGVATPETVDLVIRDGLARRLTRAGPFTTAALGGGATFGAVAANLFPELSDARGAETLETHLPEPGDAELREAAARRDEFLAEELRRDREERGDR